MPAIAQPPLLHVPDAEPIDEHQPGGHLRTPLYRSRVKLHSLAVFDDHNVILVEAGLARDLRVLEELAVLAVHWNEELGPNRIEHLAQLIPLSVTGDVDIADLGVEHPSPMARQGVDGLMNHPLVARNRPSRDDDPVPLEHVDERMPLACRPRQ